MAIKQLYHLQCLEQDIAAREQSLSEARIQTGENPYLKQARAGFARASADLSALQAEQKAAECAVADITAKMTVASESLYSGRIKNSKELQHLQRELASWQTQRDQLEETSLALMEKIERAEGNARLRHEECAAAETKWRTEQAALLDKIKALEKILEALKTQHTAALAEISAGDIAPYSQLRKTHGWAIARLEQGACGHCRLGLSTAIIQRARAGQTVNCSSCGRLLFFE